MTGQRLTEKVQALGVFGASLITLQDRSLGKNYQHLSNVLRTICCIPASGQGSSAGRSGKT